MANYRFTFRYDGTRYHGWESKTNADTVEGRIEAVLSKMEDAKVDIHGAGRTDAGVHARAMVASGRLETYKTPEEIKDYLNRYLPADIGALDVAVAGDRFHARLNATGKVYEYTLYVGTGKPVFDRNYVWCVPQGTGLDVEAMKRAASYLVGKQDFKSFCGNNKKNHIQCGYSEGGRLYPYEIPWKWISAEHGENPDRNTGRGWIWEYECGAYS